MGSIDGENGARSGAVAMSLDRTPMQINNRFANRQPQAEPAILAGNL